MLLHLSKTWEPSDILSLQQIMSPDVFGGWIVIILQLHIENLSY